MPTDTARKSQRVAAAAKKAVCREAAQALLEERFRTFLRVPTLRQAFDNPGESPDLDREVWAQFERFLIAEAKHQGPAILLADTALQTLVSWYETRQDGVLQLQKFMDAVVHGAKVRRGQAQESVGGSRWHQLKVATVSELRTLQHDVRVSTNLQPERSGWESIEATLSARPAAFPCLCNAQMRRSLSNFCHSNPNTCSCFVSGRIKAASFFDEWGAWTINAPSADSFRKDVSESQHID